jgi:excisionase family DNA binding protein
MLPALLQGSQSKGNSVKEQEILDSASQAEAKIAAIAYQRLLGALENSKAEAIELRLDLGAKGARRETPVLKLPPRALHFFASVLRHMAKGEPLLLVPQKHELTTQEAANFLKVSRPFIIKEIEAGRLKCRKINRHRRIEFEELRRYQAEVQQQAEQALQDLARMCEALEQEF